MEILKKTTRVLLFLSFINCSYSFAEKKTTKAEKSDQWSLKYYKLILGAEYLSNLSKRGATFYSSYQAFPIFSLQFFSPQLSLTGPTLYYKKQVNPYFLYRSAFKFSATGDKPFYKTGKKLTDRNKRDTTQEIDQIFEFSIPQVKGELTLTVSKDVNAHSGWYFESKIRVSPWQFEFKKLDFQPAFFALIGASDKKHNDYLYGKNADDFSVSHYSYGINLSAPPRVDHFFPILKIERYGIWGNKNKNASLIYNKTTGWQVLLLFAKKVAGS
jgi:hypothetical protein